MLGTIDTVAGVNRRLLYPIIILISLENHEAYRLFRELSNDQSYLSSSTMCYPKWASRSARNVLQINQHLNEAVGESGGTVWSRPEPSQIESHLSRPLCQFEEHAAEEHTCHREAHNGLFIGSPGDAIHTKHSLQVVHRHLPQSRASLMAF